MPWRTRWHPLTQSKTRGFGIFRLNYRRARMSRNPKTGQNVQVPCKFVPCFKAGKELRERVNHSEG